MTYLLWTRINVGGDVGLHAIYFTSESGIRYESGDGTGKFWRMPWSMKEWPFTNMRDALVGFTSKIKDKMEGGYTVISASCEMEDENEASGNHGPGPTGPEG